MDWERGFCPDGRYMWLKKGDNPATGNPYGLEQPRPQQYLPSAAIPRFVWEGVQTLGVVGGVYPLRIFALWQGGEGAERG